MVKPQLFYFCSRGSAVIYIKHKKQDPGCEESYLQPGRAGVLEEVMGFSHSDT